MYNSGTEQKIKIPQRGFVPIIARSFGVLFFIAIFITGIQEIARLFSSSQTKMEMMRAITITVLFIPFSIIALELVAGLFPVIRIVKQGIVYQRSFFARIAGWNEIEYIAKARKPFDCYVVIISRKPIYLFDLWIGSLHGLLAGMSRPVFFLSISKELRDQLANLIQKHQENKLTQKSFDLYTDAIDGN